VLLVGAATVAAWPARAVLRRLHGRRRALTTVEVRRVLSRLRELAARSPRRAAGAAVLTGAAVGLVLSGPVAGVVLAVYTALGARAVLRRARQRQARAARTRSLDDLNALAADLRAGLAVGSAGALAGPHDSRLAELTSAVWRLAEKTGAPAADLVERIEADARAGDRVLALASAQAAGARATAFLLAALPIGGIALGFWIGVDALHVLLKTPAGAICLGAAVALQCAGLLWADRLADGPTR